VATRAQPAVVGAPAGASGSVLRLRTPLPAGVVAFALPLTLLREVKVAMQYLLPVSGADSVSNCEQLLARHVGQCLLVRVPAPDEDAVVEQLMNLRARFPRVPCVALFIEGASDSRWVLRLGGAGVTELVICNQLVPSVPLTNALIRCETDSLAVRVWKCAGVQVEDALLAVVKPALRLAHAPISMLRLAAAARMHERTLRKYCDQHGFASPQWIIGWARLLTAAYYLDDAGRTVQDVAELLAFPSAASLANHVRRYTKSTPSTLRAAGAVRTVASLMEAGMLRRGGVNRVSNDTPSTILRLISS
jgi:AraC-like DNA-binding protein